MELKNFHQQDSLTRSDFNAQSRRILQYGNNYIGHILGVGPVYDEDTNMELKNLLKKRGTTRRPIKTTRKTTTTTTSKRPEFRVSVDVDINVYPESTTTEKIQSDSNEYGSSK
ncbi:uncharacterized protein LOC133530914 [Cydia pomonella]|uniref:uncharacterized protein LOC133530914 n=1 Tax=Cydia pomonella TaxID=82600 RepID=UPI002ADDCB71|nr:uncharacterized protein LOC133530914 [Cydia pomonella]